MQTPIFHYLERYRNKGTRTYSSHASYTEAVEKYQPETTHARFDLDAFEVPSNLFLIYTANPPKELVSKYLGASSVLFCIHPQMLEMFPNDLYVRQTLTMSSARMAIPVIPSSSTRTLYVEDPIVPHAVKVHFPFKISRYTRRMRDEVIEQAINVSQELENGIHQLDDSFAFFREVIGIVHKNLEPDSVRGENWGFLVRDMIPFPRNSFEETLIPGFSLYGEDYYDPETPLLLFELIKDQDPVIFVLDNIMLPIIRHWVECFLHFGYLLEPHGQNVLFELNRDNSICRIVYRDLNVGIDMRRRQEISLSENNLNNFNRMEPYAFHSITYDRFMGGHFFDRIVSACQKKFPNLSKKDFTQPCCEEFSRIFPEYRDYFPKTVWYFSEERDRFNKPLYQDTGVAPEWRPW
jgi:hypothetical protein